MGSNPRQNNTAVGMGWEDGVSHLIPLHSVSLLLNKPDTSRSSSPYLRNCTRCRACISAVPHLYKEKFLTLENHSSQISILSSFPKILPRCIPVYEPAQKAPSLSLLSTRSSARLIPEGKDGVSNRTPWELRMTSCLSQSIKSLSSRHHINTEFNFHITLLF